MELALGERIRIARTRCKKSQVELARDVGISKTTLSDIETGNTVAPSSAIITDIARVLNVSADFLLGLRDEPDRGGRSHVSPPTPRQERQKHLIGNGERIRDYFWINYAPRESWVLSITARVQRSDSPILQQRWKESAQSALTELPLALATKFEVMSITIDRLNAHIRELSKDFDENPDKVKSCIAAKAAYGTQNPRLAFEIIADLEAWIFKFRSTYEILYAFVKEFSARLLDCKVNDEKILTAILRAKGYNTDWIDFLNDERNLFVHQTAPWFAIEVTSGTPPYEIVLLKRNVHNLDDPQNYVRIEQYRAVHKGFLEALDALHAWIFKEIEKIEAKK